MIQLLPKNVIIYLRCKFKIIVNLLLLQPLQKRIIQVEAVVLEVPSIYSQHLALSKLLSK